MASSRNKHSFILVPVSADDSFTLTHTFHEKKWKCFDTRQYFMFHEPAILCLGYLLENKK